MYATRHIYLLLLLILNAGFLSASDAPSASEGILDLRTYDFENSGPVDLSGEWELYWNHFLIDDFDGYKSERHIVNVPSSWTQYIRNGIPLKKAGFASYRLLILLPAHLDKLGFKIHDVFSGSSYYINGKKFTSLGLPATNRYQTVTKVREQFVETEVEEYEIEFVVHVSNYDHRTGGIRGGITMGLPEQIEHAWNRNQHISYFLMGVFLIIGIYFLSLFLVRYEEYRFHFSMICLLMVFRIAVAEEMDISNVLNINSVARFRLEYLTFYLIIPFFIQMIRSLFPIEFNKLAFHVLLWIDVLFVLIVLFTPLKVFSYTLLFYVPYLAAVVVVILYVLFLACKRGRSYAILFTIGMSILLIGVINDLLYTTDIIETGNISQYTMFIYLVVYAHIFSAKSLRLVDRTESLSREIQSINSNLETLVEERTFELRESTQRIDKQRRELEVINKDLTEAVTSRNRMFSIIGHDIRGPIGYIRQGLELFVEDNNLTTEERNEMLRLMASTSHKTFNLLENLMLWGRTQVGNLEPKPRDVNLKSVVNECIDVMDLGIKEKALLVRVDVDEKYKVWIDRDQLLIVVRNLLSNAVKFTPEGGKISISVSEKERPDSLTIKISDNGIGIPDSLQTKLFDQDENFTTEGTNQEKGSGLGLKLCREIVEANLGLIKFESKSGKGSTFKIMIPISPNRTLSI